MLTLLLLQFVLTETDRFRYHLFKLLPGLHVQPVRDRGRNVHQLRAAAEDVVHDGGKLLHQPTELGRLLAFGKGGAKHYAEHHWSVRETNKDIR